MSEQVVEILYDSQKKSRVVIFLRSSGGYGYREEKHYKNVEAETEGWAVLWEGKSFYDSLETAKREIPTDVHWLPKQST